MKRRILVIQGHPDPSPERFDRALAASYAQGAREGGHEVRTIEVATLPFPILRERRDWEQGTAPETIGAAQADIAWADHLVIVYPLWLGSMPALLKAFLEQALRPGFAFTTSQGRMRKLLSGKSARIVVTMGMPGFVYRWYFRGHSVKSLKRNILEFCGVAPVRSSIVGMVEGGEPPRKRWLARMKALGHAAR